ncbi:SpoIIE family protein phosphatase [Streptomyces sp. NPDC047000]|uniref:PP2C family protein-serine/threonine phosphatase n=1 Tax=Streptomyces sp. NPDC047000 TaxID=3155474 RepID=UPI0033E1D8CC
MPSPRSADRPAAQPPARGSVDELITRTRRLRTDMDAVRQGALGTGPDPRHPQDPEDPRERWQRALCELALRQLDDLGAHLAQLREGPPPVAEEPPGAGAAPRPAPGSPLTRVGSAEWNLLTDGADWSGELYGILGRDPATAPLTLDELPSLVLDEDRPALTAMVTDCLVDARRIDGEFRVLRPDGTVRTVHMMGEPVLGADGGTVSMWAVLRDVSELRRRRRTVRESGDALQLHRQRAQTERRLTVELQESVLPPWRGALRLPHRGPRALDLAAHYLPAATGPLIGGGWYDALELTDGDTLLSVGDLTGHGVTAASGMAMLLGALRGMAMAGTRPGELLGLLNRLLDATVQPALGSTVCCSYRPATRTLRWAQAGHPAPLLFRGGAGRVLGAPGGVLLGATSGAVYEEAEETLEPGDLLLLHTDSLAPRHWDSSRPYGSGAETTAAHRLLGLAPRLGEGRTAQDGLRAVVEEFGESERQDDACVLVARVTS